MAKGLPSRPDKSLGGGGGSSQVSQDDCWKMEEDKGDTAEVESCLCTRQIFLSAACVWTLEHQEGISLAKLNILRAEPSLLRT